MGLTKGVEMTALTISPIGPYDFELSLRLTRTFSPVHPPNTPVLCTAVRVDDKPAVLELQQLRHRPPLLGIQTDHADSASEIKRIVKWIIFADLDLHPFYRIAAPHSILGPITHQLHGLKPMRPASLFEMLIIAITEQQISMTAAFHIRMRIIERYGEQVKGFWTFPTALKLCTTTITDLMKCGLSRRKAEYVRGLAEKVAHGHLDLDQFESMSDEEVRSLLLQIRGLGPWSADYFLVRGLSRPDRVPADDLGIRSVVGRYLGRGQRLSPQGTMRKLAPFKPYRGLAAFYLLAHARLSKPL
jgi:DNA-3-methyladenine glycosylase II